MEEGTDLYEKLKKEFGIEGFFIFYGNLHELENRDKAGYQVIACGDESDGRIISFARGKPDEKTEHVFVTPNDKIDPDTLKRAESALHRVGPYMSAEIIFDISAKSYGADGAIRCERKIDKRKDGSVWVEDYGIPVTRKTDLSSRVYWFFRNLID